MTKTSLDNNFNFQKILGNISWLFLDKVFRLGIGLFVGAWIARYLGPSLYGLWSYTIAFSALFGAFATLGLDSIVVRELVRYPEKTNLILGTTFILRLFGSLLAFILPVISIQVILKADFITLSLILLSSVGFIFQVFFVIDLFYQAHVMSRYTVWAQNISFFIMTIVRIFLILIKASLIAFAIAGLIEIIITSVFLVIFYLHQKKSFKDWKFDLNTAKYLLSDSWPLILSDIAILIYMRIDQVMIRQMLDDRAVGIYSAAIRLVEVWYFVPMIVATSFLPVIVNSKKVSEELYQKRFRNLYTFMIWLSIGIGSLITIFSNMIMNVLYGSEYQPLGGKVLSISIWASLFVFLGVISSQFLLTENYTKISLIRTIVGAFVNVILNYFMIPAYGIIGASIASLVSYFIAVFFIIFVPDRNIRRHVKLIFLSFLPRK